MLSSSVVKLSIRNRCVNANFTSSRLFGQKRPPAKIHDEYIEKAPTARESFERMKVAAEREAYNLLALRKVQESSQDEPQPQANAPPLKVTHRLTEKALRLGQCSFETYSGLLTLEKEIYVEHLRAVKNMQLQYIDPFTKFKVFTTLAHLARGTCCGSACRHCPYQHQNAPEHLKSAKVWNGVFYMPKIDDT